MNVVIHAQSKKNFIAQIFYAFMRHNLSTSLFTLFDGLLC